ncbi:hypothetical protein HOS55_gp104 [Pseudomonas phage PMBT3]|uniref:Uncharacterized protein n=1 Tax=Pseudomonas phage PMBT3 TaxID=2059856 RepID=A0A2I6PI21_9CAUD|nr:hypothetical protein HOS55_gp104 [Pseudomonas phage PMBT3]AUM59706.1 hypothetical protein [Pseudomonas phage PMBT3]
MFYQLKTALIKSHWEMVDSLSTEIYFGPPILGASGHLLYNLFSSVAWEDPRFQAVGWGRCPDKHCMTYTDPMGITYYGAHAVGQFLGTDMKTLRKSENHRGETLEYYAEVSGTGCVMIFRNFPSTTHFHEWVRWHVQKQRGFTNKTKDLHTGYRGVHARDFPDTLKLINELYPQKD